MRNSFASTLKAYRVLRGMRQEDLARRLGCSRQMVSLWESGHSLPSPPMLTKLCRVLRVRKADLMPENAAGRPRLRASRTGA